MPQHYTAPDTISIVEIDQIKLLYPRPHLYAIALNGGLYSYKTISWNTKKKKFKIFNHIDQSTVWLTQRQLNDTRCTNVGLAIKKRALWIFPSEEPQHQ